MEDNNRATPASTSAEPVEARAGDLIGYRAAAAVLAVPVGTLYSWVHQRRIPYVRLGPRQVRFSRRALAAWLRERTVQPVTVGQVSESIKGTH